MDITDRIKTITKLSSIPFEKQLPSFDRMVAYQEEWLANRMNSLLRENQELKERLAKYEHSTEL